MINSHVLAFIGEQRAGKGTAAEIYRKISKKNSGRPEASRHTFSDAVREILNERGIPFGRIAAQNLVMEMIDKDGSDTLSKLVEKRIWADPNKFIIIDGIRLWSDYRMMCRFPVHHLVYITAPAEIRYKRAILNKDKSDESDISFEEFCERENHRLERSIPAIGINAASHYIVNSGNLEELGERMSELYDEIKF